MEPRFTKNSLSRWPQCQSRTGRAFDNKSGRKNEFFVYFCSILIGITSKHQVPYSWTVSLQLVTINIYFLEKCKTRLSISLGKIQKDTFLYRKVPRIRLTNWNDKMQYDKPGLFSRSHSTFFFVWSILLPYVYIVQYMFF